MSLHPQDVTLIILITSFLYTEIVRLFFLVAQMVTIQNELFVAFVDDDNDLMLSVRST